MNEKNVSPAKRALFSSRAKGRAWAPLGLYLCMCLYVCVYIYIYIYIYIYKWREEIMVCCFLKGCSCFFILYYRYISVLKDNNIVYPHCNKRKSQRRCHNLTFQELNMKLSEMDSCEIMCLFHSRHVHVNNRMTWSSTNSTRRFTF